MYHIKKCYINAKSKHDILSNLLCFVPAEDSCIVYPMYELQLALLMDTILLPV